MLPIPPFEEPETTIELQEYFVDIRHLHGRSHTSSKTCQGCYIQWLIQSDFFPGTSKPGGKDKTESLPVELDLILTDSCPCCFVFCLSWKNMSQYDPQIMCHV